MATRTVRIDDFDGKSEGAEPVFFSLQDEFWMMDLAPANLKKLEDTLKPFIAAAQTSQAPRGGKRSPASAYSNNGHGEVDNAQVRAWAQANGHELGDRGRIPQEIVEAYQAAQAAAKK